MTLHEAIIQILKSKGEELSTQQIADELNRTKLYEKKDKSLIKSSQISARVRKKEYKKIFICNRGIISLREQ